MGVLLKKNSWSRSKKASTDIIEGRRRQEDAVFQGPGRYKRFTTSISHGTLSGTTRTGTTRTSKGGSNDNTQFELDEMKLIGGQGRMESREGIQNHQQWPGNVEVTREVRIDSSSIV